jgi:hypothetical protein
VRTVPVIVETESKSNDTRWPTVAALLGLAALLLANYLYRRVLEKPELRLTDFVHVFYPDGERAIFSGHYPWWKFLLPMKELGGSWMTIGLVFTSALNRVIGPAGTWYAFNALLILVSFGTSWLVFRSLVFSYTLALCMGFGTQLYHTYAVSGTIGMPLLVAFYEVALLAAYKAIAAPGAQTWRRWAVAFYLSVIAMALSYEGWLDFLVYSVIAAAVIAVPLARSEQTKMSRLSKLIGGLLIIGALYVWIKVRLGYGQGSGSESDVIFNYSRLAPMVEDFVSNSLTHLYIAFSNFLPPAFTSSTALYSMGGAQLVAEQHGYHAPFSYLIPMSYLFFWRYAAGAVGAVFVYALLKLIRSLWAAPSKTNVPLTLFVLMMGFGGSTHAWIKARPMNSAPILGYHVQLGVLGAALLIAFGLMYLQRMRVSWAAAGIVATWLVVLYSAMTRPAMLSHLAAQVGLGEGMYPDPWRAAEVRLGIPITRPGGDAPYKLVPAPPRGYSSDQSVERRPEWFAALSRPLPLPSEWRPVVGGLVRVDENEWQMRGDAMPYQRQLVSPRLDVPQNHKVRVRLDVTREQGRVCIGVLDRITDVWIVAPEVLAQEYEFDSGVANDVRIVVSNCDPRLSENPVTVFRIARGSYEPI